MSIRMANKDDLQLVKEITIETIHQIYPHYYPKGAVEFFIEHHNDVNISNDIEAGIVFLCMDENEQAVGTVTLKENDICRLFVLPEYQGLGYGRELLDFAENERFEDAARCRDCIEALKKLRDSQKVVGSPDDEYDIISVYTDNLSTCISVFYIRSGIISDSDTYLYGAYEISMTDDYEFMSQFIVDLYSKREYIPSEILLGFDMQSDELDLVQSYVREISKRAIKIRIPQKGDTKKLCDMVTKNAEEQAKQYKNKLEQDNKVLLKLSQMLSLDTVPNRIESYDISNLGNEHITAGMIVYEDGKLLKGDYRVFKIKNQDGADDYSAMKEVLKRRIEHLSDSNGSFSKLPDLILLDGGMTHVSVARQVFDEMNIGIPVFGMVKDEHHKTRTLVTDSEEISIAKEQAVFVCFLKC